MNAADTVTPTLPLAFLAVAQHQVDHNLPPFTCMEAPRRVLGADAVLVWVNTHAVPAWLDSLIVDDETTEPGTIHGWSHHTYTCRLPDHGIRVTIKASLPTNALTSVKA